MERKFKSKLVAAKASDVRKQAIVHLKESIELVIIIHLFYILNSTYNKQYFNRINLNKLNQLIMICIW